MQYRLLRNRKETSVYSGAFRDFLRAVDAQFKPRLSRRGPGIEGKVQDFINAHSIVALNGKAIVGAAVFWPDYKGTKKPYIDFVARRPDMRSRGLGSELLGRAVTHLQSRGQVPLTVSTYSNNRAALALYEKFGFKVAKVEKNARGPGINRLHLIRAAAGRPQPKLHVPIRRMPKQQRANASIGKLRPNIMASGGKGYAFRARRHI